MCRICSLLVRAGCCFFFFFSEFWENMQMRGEGDVFHSDLAWLAYIMKWMRVILCPSASFTCFLLKKHHHLRCGQKQWILAQLHLLMERKYKNKKQATCSKCGLNSLKAQTVANRPERVRAWKDKWLLLKHPRMDTKKMAVRVCVFVPVHVSSSAPTGEEELKEGQIYPALTTSAYRPLNGGGTKHIEKPLNLCKYT